MDVEFPGVPGCLICGSDMDEAHEMAIDALAAWLEAAEDQVVEEKSLSFEEVRDQFPNSIIMRIPVDRGIMKNYEPKQRFNASFPKSVLEKVDAFARSKGWNRPQFLARASEKMMAEQ